MKTKLHSVVVAFVAVMMPITMWAEIITGTCGENVTFSYNTETQVLTISGSGDMDSAPRLDNYIIRKVIIEHGITSICDNAFQGQSNIRNVDIPSSVARIGDMAFSGILSLEELILPEGVKYIGRSAFSSCYEVKSLRIPNSVIDIAGGAFDMTGWWIDQPEGLVYLDSWLLGSKGEYAEHRDSVAVDEGTKGIAGDVFHEREHLIYVSLPNSLKYISRDAFQHRGTDLEVLAIPDNVIHIGDNAFAGVYIHKGTIPNSVMHIGYYAFSSCNFKDLVLPKNLVYMGIGAFAYCDSLKSATIPESLSSISESAFSFCTSLTKVSIPNTITSIGKSAFTGCKSLTEITIPESVTMIGEKAFLECESLVEFVVPNKVERIGANAFNGCSSLVNVSIPNSVNYIGNYTFYNCDSLKEAFVGCKWEANPQYLYNPLYRFDDSVVVSANLHSYENGKCTECGTTDPTGIDVIRAESNRTSVIYDLQGRRVVNPVKNGIYIVNGELKVLTD